MSPAPAGLPERPRLKPHVAVVPFGDDQVILKGPGTFVRLGGGGVPLLNRLLPSLDGDHDLAALVEATGLAADDVLDVVAALHADGALEDGALDAELDLGADERAQLAHQLNLWSHLLHRPGAAQQRLRNATVAVIGLGRVGTAAAEGLSGAGIGRLVVADWAAIEAPDRILAPYVAADGHRADAMADHLRDRPTLGGVEARRFSKGDPRQLTRDDLAEVIDGAQHVVVAADRPISTLFNTANEAALDAGVAWTGAWLDDLQAIVGPTVVPRASACWRCYELRVMGAHPNMDRLVAYEQAREAGLAQRASVGLPGAGTTAGAMAAQAALLTLSGAVRPPLAGRVVLVDLLTLAGTPHRVLRLPRCPACSPDPVPDVDRLALDPVTLS